VKNGKKIGFQGVRGAYSNEAAVEFFGDDYNDFIECISFKYLIDFLGNGGVDFACIPVENSTAGIVQDVHNIIQKTRINIVGEKLHKVNHCLLGKRGAKLSDIQIALSHPQALMQCANFCRSNNIKPSEYMDTAAAAAMVGIMPDNSSAAIASKLCAEIYDLDILAENIQDEPDNTTLFHILAPKPQYPAVEETDAVLTTLLFTARNIPGALYKALGAFSTNNINLLNIESYIKSASVSNNNAQFLITFVGHIEDASVQAALEELGFFSMKVEVLGCYKADKLRGIKR
jgi:prephenate dehydratase